MSKNMGLAKLRKSSVVFVVGDIAATIPWYEGLGFRADVFPASPPHTFCILERDEVVIMLQQLDGYTKPELYSSRKGGVWSVYIDTDDVWALHRTLTQRSSVKIIRGPTHQLYGQCELEVVDPNGYILVFAQPSTADCFCPCCESEFPAFLDWSPDYRNVVCPNCDSHPRHRVFWLSVQRSGLLHGKKLRLLHFAPEGILRRLVSSSPNITYISADREQGNVDVWLDLTRLPCPDHCVDVVLCSHVLGVVPEDRVALRELFRILRPGGWAWLQVSLNDEIATTLEDPSLTSPQERKRLFRDESNIRLYGRDFADRVRCAGFTFVEEDFTRKNLSPVEARRYGLDPRETLYFGKRPRT